jgi:predicted nuclease with TOPRIM domain
MNTKIRIVNCIKQIETLDVKKNEIENKIKGVRQDLAKMDLAVAHIKEAVSALKQQIDEMEEGLKLDSLHLYDAPLCILKGMSIRDY